MSPKSKQSERDKLHKTLNEIANDLRGKVDGWDFKAYVLGTLFYRYLCEHLVYVINTEQIEAGDEGFNYAELDDETAEDAREHYTEMLGYYILPSQLFDALEKGSKTNQNLNIDLDKAFRAVEESTVSADSADDFAGLFQDFDISSNRLGGSVKERSERLGAIMRAVKKLELGGFSDTTIDVFGDAYEYLLRMYASNAGRSGGEHFTPQEVSEVLADIAVNKRTKIRRAYDPCTGSGSLLFRFAKHLGIDNIEDGLYGQEINPTNHALSRMNMLLHGVPFEKFDIRIGDTLMDPQHLDVQPFDAIVSNPPYSQKWPGKEDVTLINDERYSPAGVLAPKSKSDLAFTMHMLHHLEEDGVAAIVEFPGILYRGGDEQKIRKYLINNNFVDAVIQLPPNLFFGTSISTVILVLKKNRDTTDVLFVDAAECFTKQGAKNTLSEADQKAITDLYFGKKDVPYKAVMVPQETVKDKDFNLSVNTYVEKEDTREEIDIEQLNSDIAETNIAQADFKARVDAIVAELKADGLV
ncbi:MULTISPECIES: type I restriction-modification system subunit M [unclassified Corynebacterium]|uniref:type I restriction-modification system subunit M n=1 Tax=unclassified Corynebacterium TaxID=2624378 RepID=UPI0034CE9539